MYTALRAPASPERRAAPTFYLARNAMRRVQSFFGIASSLLGGTGNVRSQLSDIASLSKEVWMWDVKAAEDGDREAQFKVAETYEHGSSVVQAAMPAAAKMYEAAAKQGHLEAARRYAHCLLDGKGVDKDAAAAVEWFAVAAEGGHVDAQFQLGLCYHTGTGTAKDLDLTIKWLQKAGEQRNVEAQYRLGMIFQQSISADQVSPLNTAWYPPRRGIPHGVVSPLNTAWHPP